MATETVNPCGIFNPENGDLAPRFGLRAGMTVGLFSNMKNNADLFLDNVSELLSECVEGLEFVRFRKEASEPAPFKENDPFLENSEFVVACFAD